MNKKEILTKKELINILLAHTLVAIIFGFSLIAILASKGYAQTIASLTFVILSGYTLTKTLTTLATRTRTTK